MCFHVKHNSGETSITCVLDAYSFVSYLSFVKKTAHCAFSAQWAIQTLFYFIRLNFRFKSTLESAQTASPAGASTLPLYTALSSWPSVAATRVVAAAAPTTLVAVRAISAMLEMGESRMMASTGRPAAANRAVMESDGRLLQNATSLAISQWIQYAKRAAVHTHSGSCYLPIFYFAYSTARLSRMTLTLIWPG